MIPWSYNASNKPDSEILWTQYDHFTCLMIEIFYKRYKAGDLTYQQIPIPGYYVIDFKYMMQISTLDPTK